MYFIPGVSALPRRVPEICVQSIKPVLYGGAVNFAIKLLRENQTYASRKKNKIPMFYKQLR